jgi:hypothetical protein
MSARLPPDLQAAFDAAATLIRWANLIAISAVPRDWSEVLPGAEERETALSLAELGRREIEKCTPAALEAIEAVAVDLNATRDRPARFGQIVERNTGLVAGDFIIAPNAHLAACEFANEAMLRLTVAYLNGPPSSPEDVAGCFKDWPPFLHKEIMAEAALEASKAAATRPVRARLIIDRDARKAILDGRPFENVDLNGLLVLEAIMQAGPGYTPKRKLRDRLPNCNHDNVFDRWVDRLPSELKALVDGKSGAGVALRFDPLL